MYAFIQGQVENIEKDHAVIEAGGVGYLVFCTGFTLGALQTGKPARIYTSLQVREDSMTLYGFNGQEERAMFEKLLNVSGVGPKLAMSVLSKMRPDDIIAAVFTEDVSVFKGSGVGEKTAQKIMLELKGKLDNIDIGKGMQMPSSSAAASKMQEASAALVALGYGASEALKAIKQVGDESMDLETLIKLALQKLSKH